MPAFFQPPAKIPWFLRLGIWFAERQTGKPMLPARLLAWYPRAAFSSGILEALVAHHDGRLDARILKLVRMTASFAVGCSFCVDMNSFEYAKENITEDQVRALRGEMEVDSTPGFSEREKIAITYTRRISATPLLFDPALQTLLRDNFTEREIVVLASTAAQANYWGRLIQALGIPPAGFLENCPLPPPTPTRP